VLIISNYEGDRETIPLLLGSMGCRCTLAPTLDEAVGVLNRESAAAAILDSRLAMVDSEEKSRTLREILVRLPGRVILLLSEMYDSAAIDFATTYSLPFLKRDRWAQDLWGSLENLLRLADVTHQPRETARLALDTFGLPLPTGARLGRRGSRHLLYETNSLSIDVSFELLPGFSRMSLCGQILMKVDPKLAVHGATVRLRGRDRPLGFVVTNQSGEFSFEFEIEPNVILEMEDKSNHCVTIHSPNPIWVLENELQNMRERDARQPARSRANNHSKTRGR
jgi:hypothetical protein